MSFVFTLLPIFRLKKSEKSQKRSNKQHLCVDFRIWLKEKLEGILALSSPFSLAQSPTLFPYFRKLLDDSC